MPLRIVILTINDDNLKENIFKLMFYYISCKIVPYQMVHTTKQRLCQIQTSSLLCHTNLYSLETEQKTQWSTFQKMSQPASTKSQIIGLIQKCSRPNTHHLSWNNCTDWIVKWHWESFSIQSEPSLDLYIQSDTLLLVEHKVILCWPLASGRYNLFQWVEIALVYLGPDL